MLQYDFLTWWWKLCTWLVSWPFVENSLVQSVHLKSFVLSCIITMCLFMVPSCPKVLKQIWHSWSLTFSWTCKIWFRKRWWSGKYLRQTPHFDPYLTLYSSGWHSRKWVFRSVNLVKSLGQTSHGKCFFILRRSFFKDLLCGKIFLECFRLRKMWRKFSSWRRLCLQFFKRGRARTAES